MDPNYMLGSPFREYERCCSAARVNLGPPLALRLLQLLTNLE